MAVDHNGCQQRLHLCDSPGNIFLASAQDATKATLSLEVSVAAELTYLRAGPGDDF